MPPEAGFQEIPAPEAWILQKSGIRTWDFRNSKFAEALFFKNLSFRGLGFSKIQVCGSLDFRKCKLPGGPRRGLVFSKIQASRKQDVDDFSQFGIDSRDLGTVCNGLETACGVLSLARSKANRL